MDDVYLTFDLDWAPEPVVEFVVQRLVDVGVKATFFATHVSPAMGEAARHGCEVALHPNFDGSLPPSEKLAQLKGAYPDAIGARAHSLVSSSRILEAYAALGLRYESNVFLPFHPELQVIERLPGLHALPFYWMDDHHLLFGRAFDSSAVRLDVPGLKILTFHPIHVYANTCSPDHYSALKPSYQDAEALTGHVHRGLGIRTVFEQVLHIVSESGGGSTLDRLVVDTSTGSP